MFNRALLPQLPSELLLQIVGALDEKKQTKARLFLESSCKAMHRVLKDKAWEAVHVTTHPAQLKWVIALKPLTRSLAVESIMESLDVDHWVVQHRVPSISLPALVELGCGDLDLGHHIGSFPALRTLSCSNLSLGPHSSSLPALTELSCGVLNLGQHSGCLPALTKLRCRDLSLDESSISFPALVEIECDNVHLGRSSVALPALVKLSCGELSLGQYSGSFPALVEFECWLLCCGQSSAAFPALRELTCHVAFHLEESSASFPALEELCCMADSADSELYGELWFGQSTTSFPALARIWCQRLQLEQYRGSFPALKEIMCWDDENSGEYEDYEKHWQLSLGQYSGSFPTLARDTCGDLNLDEYTGSFPALTTLALSGGVEGVELGTVFPALRGLYLSQLVPELCQPLQLLPGITGLECHESQFPDPGSPCILHLKELNLWGVERDLPAGLGAAADLETLEFTVARELSQGLQLSKKALAVLAQLKLQSLIYVEALDDKEQTKARLVLESSCKAVHRALKDKAWEAVHVTTHPAQVEWMLARKPLTRSLAVKSVAKPWADPEAVQKAVEAVVWASRRIMGAFCLDCCTVPPRVPSVPLPLLVKLSCGNLDLGKHSGSFFALTQLNCSNLSLGPHTGIFPALNELICVDLSLGQHSGSFPALTKLSCREFSLGESSTSFPALVELKCDDIHLSRSSASFPALTKLRCGDVSLGESSTSFPALVELECDDVDLSQSSVALPALAKLSCGDLSLGQYSGSFPALVALQCWNLYFGQSSATFPALKELTCHMDICLEESSASLPALTELCCLTDAAGGGLYGELWFGQSTTSFPALAKISCRRLQLEQYRGSFPALVEIECWDARNGEYFDSHGYEEHGEVSLGEYSGSFPSLAKVTCGELELKRYSGAFPALTTLSLTGGVEGVELGTVFPALRSLHLSQSTPGLCQPLQLPAGVTSMQCLASHFPEPSSPCILHLKELNLRGVERDLPAGLGGAADLETLQLTVARVLPGGLQLSEKALATLARLKLQSLQYVDVWTAFLIYNLCAPSLYFVPPVE
ncbi:hypothetical protein N2152v2_007925 [Parachlorella kessleri]